VAYTGLRKWAEIDIARARDPLPLLVGAGAAAFGLLLLAHWLLRQLWRRRLRPTGQPEIEDGTAHPSGSGGLGG